MKRAISIIICTVLTIQSMSVCANSAQNQVAEQSLETQEFEIDNGDGEELLHPTDDETESANSASEEDISTASSDDGEAVNVIPVEENSEANTNDTNASSLSPAPQSETTEDILIDFSKYDVGAILYNWHLQNANEEQAVVSKNKTLVLTAKLKEDGQNYDPFFTVIHDKFSAIKYSVVKLGLRWTGAPSGVSPEIYFKTNTHSKWENGDYYQSAVPNSAYSSQKTIEFTFDMTEKAGWNGTITELRIDPANTEGTFELDYIRFVSNGNQIIYDANGGASAPRNLTHLENGVYELSAEQPTRNGYKFIGWSLSANGTAADIVKTVTIEDADVTVYAVWERKLYGDKSYGFASDFDVDNDFGGWTLSAASFRKKEVSDGSLKLETIVNDARMHKAFESGAELFSQYCLLKMRYKPIRNAHTVILRWQRSVDPYADNDIVNAHENERVQSLYLPGEANKWHEITFDLSKNTAWNGNIRALWLDVANYWEIQEDNPGKIEYDYIRFYRKGDNRLNYDANISLAADVSGNAEVTVTNMPENESNVPTGSGYLVSKVVPVASDSSIYFAGWSSSKTSTALVDEEMYVGDDMTLYAVWKPRAVSKADFPYISQHPAGIRRVSDALWKDIAQSKPMNTGFETVTDINDIRDDSYNDRRSAVDEAYEGRFALKLKTDTVSDLYPLKELKSESATPFVSVFAPGEKAKTPSASYLIETPLPEEAAETYAASALSNAAAVNKITLQVKPKYQAKELSFYLRTISSNGYAMYVKILDDKNGDGIFVCHEDFEPGQWNGITLDLHQTEQMLPNGVFSGLFVKVNENSEWLFDSVEGDYQKVSQADLNLEALAKDNLVFESSSLHFSEVESTDLKKYDVKPVITSAMYDMEGEIRNIDCNLSQFSDKQSGYQATINKNILPDLFSGSNIFQINAVLTNGSDGEEYYVERNNSIQLSMENLEPGLYQLSVNARRISTDKSYLYVKLNESNSMTIPLKSTNFYPYHTVLPITEASNTIILTSAQMYVNGVVLTKIDPAETNKRTLFAGIPYTESIPCTGTEVTFQDLPYIPNGTYTGSSDAIQCNLTKTEYMLVTVINPSYERVATMEVGTNTYNLNYGKWDYIIAVTGSTVSKITFSYGKEPILVTEAKKYDRFPGNTTSAVDTGISDGRYSPNCAIVYYIEDKDIYACDFESGETRQITDCHGAETLTLKALSPNGKYLIYSSMNNCDYIYSYENNVTVIGENVKKFSKVDNNGICYGVNDTAMSVYLKADGTAVLCINDDKSTYTVSKNDGSGWYSFSSGTIPVEKKFIKDIVFDEVNFQVYIIVEDAVYENSKFVYSSNPGVNVFDPLTGSLSWLNITSGTLLSATEAGNLVMNIDAQILLVNPTTKERKLIYTGAVSNPVYYNESTNRLIFKNKDNHVMHYTAKAHANAVKLLLSFDDGKQWQTYQNGRWISVYGDGMEPTAEIFEKYGMTAAQLTALSEKDFRSLYENGKEIYTLGIALCITSESEYNTPKIHNITVHTTEPNPNRYLYTAKGQTYSKNDYSRIGAIFANTNIYGADECYYFLCLGNDWIYTYKDGELLRMKQTASGLFGNVSGNWQDIRQYGMSEAELRAVPEAVLTSLLLNERYANDSFTVAYCIKTDCEETNGISAAFHLVYDPKTAAVNGKTVKILLSDQSVLTLSSEDIDESEAERFLLWLETKQAGGKGSPFFKLTAKDRIYYINYYMIKSVEICVE